MYWALAIVMGFSSLHSPTQNLMLGMNYHVNTLYLQMSLLNDKYFLLLLYNLVTISIYLWELLG